MEPPRGPVYSEGGLHACAVACCTTCLQHTPFSVRASWPVIGYPHLGHEAWRDGAWQLTEQGLFTTAVVSVRYSVTTVQLVSVWDQKASASFMVWPACRLGVRSDLPQLLSGDQHLGQPLQLCSLLLHGAPDAVHLSADRKRHKQREWFLLLPNGHTHKAFIHQSCIFVFVFL